MTRLIFAAFSIARSTAAFAQNTTAPATPPNDDEVAAAVASCRKPENFDLIPPKDAQAMSSSSPANSPPPAKAQARIKELEAEDRF
jgi:hypothetical protein